VFYINCKLFCQLKKGATLPHRYLRLLQEYECIRIDTWYMCKGQYYSEVFSLSSEVVAVFNLT